MHVFQLDSDSEQRPYHRMTSQSSISSHLSASMEHIMSVMAHHPKYLHCFQRTHYYLMHEDGSLPFDYRHFIAIMVSCSAHCLSRLMTTHTVCGIYICQLLFFPSSKCPNVFQVFCDLDLRQLRVIPGQAVLVPGVPWFHPGSS